MDSKLIREPGVEIRMILVNYGTHKTAAVKRWFLRHPEYHLHFTPTSGSWLNLVERIFGEITEKRIWRGAFRSVAALESAIRESLDHHNASPEPFEWPADADLILSRVKKVVERISDSGQRLAKPHIEPQKAVRVETAAGDRFSCRSRLKRYEAGRSPGRLGPVNKIGHRDADRTLREKSRSLGVSAVEISRCGYAFGGKKKNVGRTGIVTMPRAGRHEVHL